MAIQSIPTAATFIAADTSPTNNTIALRDNQGGLAAKILQGTNLQTTGTVQLPSPPTKTAAFSVDASATVFILDGTSAAFTATLPAASGAPGRVYAFTKKDAVNNVTVQGNGSELINGANTFVLTTQYQTLRLISDGTQWWAF